MIFSHLDKEIFEIFLQEFCKHLNLQEKPKDQETWLVVDRAKTAPKELIRIIFAEK